MATNTAVLRIKIGADSYEFNRAVQKVQSDTQKMAVEMQRVGKNMSMFFTAPLAAAAAIGVKLYDTQARAEVKVEQAIKSTASAARLSFEELKKFASELQGKTIFGDEEILNKSTAQLLTFTNLAGVNFKRAQVAAMDLSTVLDGDLQSASLQLGKALNDPVKSLSALRKSGVMFSNEQETVIKKLAQTGELAKAQSIMLTEIEKQYGGQAERRAKEGAGGLIQLKNKWGDFLEMIGSSIMPAINALAQKIGGMVDWLMKLSPATKNAILSMTSFIAIIGPTILIVGKLITVIKALSVTLATSTFGIAITALVALGAVMAALIGYTRGASREIGENEKAVAKETKEVNILVAKLTSANVKEEDRKKILKDLVAINPSILNGIDNEATGYETLRRNLKAFNEEQVRKLALAKLTDKENSLLGGLGDLEVEKIEATERGLAKIFEITQKVKNGSAKHVNGSATYFESILKSNKLSDYQKIAKFQESPDFQNFPIDDAIELVSIKNQLDAIGKKTKPIQAELEGLQTTISKTEKSITDQLKKTVGGEDDLDDLSKKIKEITDKISELETVKQSTKDVDVISAIDSQIAQLKVNLSTLKKKPLIDEDGADKATGIIGKLTEQIKRLETAKGNAETKEDVASINSQIETLKKQLDELNIVTSDYLALRAKMADTPSFGGLSMVVPNISATVAPIKLNTDTAFDDLKKQLNDKFKELGNVNFAKHATQKIAKTLSKYGVDAAKGMTEEMIAVATTIQERASEAMRIVANGMSDVIVATVDAIASGSNIGDALQNVLSGILGTIGKFLIDLGTQAIMTGTIMKAFQEAIRYLMANPLLAVAAGVAMVALGSVLTASLKRKQEKSAPKLANGGLAYGPTYAMVGDNIGAKVDPEVIAPLSKLKGLMGGSGGGNLNIRISGKLVANGRDLSLVLAKENYKIKVMGS